jgi:hypothetical protein
MNAALGVRFAFLGVLGIALICTSAEEIAMSIEQSKRLVCGWIAPELPEQRRVLSQPQFRRSVIRTEVFHFPPESRRMVHLPQMRQFMEDEIITNMRRCLDQPPIEGNGPSPGTRAPAGP